jgi:hypothetical protein
VITFEGFEELDDIRVFECSHGVNLLNEASLELGVFDHFLLGETFDGVI